MRTTILAYVIAIIGLALIVAGAWDIYVLYNEQTFEVTFSDYGVAIRTISGGLIMVGLAQALRLLLEINAREAEAAERYAFAGKPRSIKKAPLGGGA
jgi:hypothetical protein